jgi:hypothetical protein
MPELDMSDVKPSLVSFAIVTLMAIAGISLMKYLMARFPVPGLKQLVDAV